MIEDMIKREDYSYQKLARILSRKKVNLRDYKMIAFPINLKNFHWFVVVFDVTKETFYMIDSMQGS